MNVICCQVPMKSMQHSKEMKLLAYNPMFQARRFGAYSVNGYKFRTITKEDGLKTKNSRVYDSSSTRSYASMRDNRVADTTTSRGIKQDHLGLTSVSFSHPIHTGDREDDEPYILASEAYLVYYVDDEVDKEWSVVGFM
ncbi:hypothetical protein AHAS_Ahas11G0059500 [Arachis hypogaea]